MRDIQVGGGRGTERVIRVERSRINWYSLKVLFTLRGPTCLFSLRAGPSRLLGTGVYFPRLDCVCIDEVDDVGIIVFQGY